MRKTLFYASMVFFAFSCDNNTLDSSENQSVGELEQAYEQFKSLEKQVQGFQNLGTDLENTQSGKTINECIQADFNIPVDGSAIVGFGGYNVYSAVILDYIDAECEPANWNGRLEYYLANNGNNTLKDSLVLKEVSYGTGYTFSGFRTSIEDSAQSNTQKQYFDVVIDGVVVDTNGKSHRYTASRSMSFTKRFTASEQILFNETAVLEGIDDDYSIRANTNVASPLLFDASCFDGADFLRYPVQGNQRFDASFTAPFTVDYGDGNCDKRAVLTNEKGEQYEIEAL